MKSAGSEVESVKTDLDFGPYAGGGANVLLANWFALHYDVRYHFVSSDRTRELDAMAGRGDSHRRRKEAEIPLGRYGDPVEFGTVAAFVLSAPASYLTGAMIPIDGGARRAI